MSRSRLVPFKPLPAVLAAALAILGSTTIASAQYYDQSPPPAQGAPDQNVQTDPPDRVARLAYLTGDVELAPAGEDDWGDADINRPLITGDRLMTGNDGRAALELGDAALRIDDNSAFNFLDLNDTSTQVELSQGTLNMRVRTIANGQTYEIDTPTAAFVAGQPGTYRVDVAPDGNGAMVTVFEGSGTVYGENGVSRPVQAGQSYRFNDSALANVQVQRVPAPDDFDRFCQSRDQRYTNSVSRRYVAPEVVGYDDLDQYGDWQSTPDYGEVWYPSRVAAGWAPYRDGHWAWIEPWGWTWVDSEPWGYAPFHYGRWVNVSNRWGWVPGPRTVRPVYAPALVAFVGGSGISVSVSVGGGNPVGWFPLGPRDVYVPPYRASRHYFTDINVSNIRNVYVNQTVINNYYSGYTSGHRYTGGREYAYRNNPRAFTAVPRNVFAGARPVRAAVLRVNPAALAKATIAPMPHVTPTRASLAIRASRHPIATPVAKAFHRTVVARHEPPPRAVPFAAREKVIARQGGAPIPVAQLHQMRQQHAKAQPQPQRVKVVAAEPNRGAMVPNGKRPPVEAPRNGAKSPYRASIHPIQAPVNPVKGSANHPPRKEPMRQGELPSARFAHHPQNGTNPPAQHAAENQQRTQQARQKADQAKRNDAHAQALAEQRRAQEAKANAGRNAAQARQSNEKARAEQAQARHRANEQKQQAAKARTEQAQARQRADEQKQQAAKARTEQAQARQRADEQKQQAQQHANQERQRADKERAQRQQQQAAQARQRDQQAEAREVQQQRAQQQRQREQQVHAQQARESQARQQEQRARQQQHPQHAPPAPHPKQQKKKKDHDQQDKGH